MDDLLCESFLRQIIKERKAELNQIEQRRKCSLFKDKKKKLLVKNLWRKKGLSWVPWVSGNREVFMNVK